MTFNPAKCYCGEPLVKVMLHDGLPKADQARVADQWTGGMRCGSLPVHTHTGTDGAHYVRELGGAICNTGWMRRKVAIAQGRHPPHEAPTDCQREGKILRSEIKGSRGSYSWRGAA